MPEGEKMETDVRTEIGALRRSQDRLASLVQPLNAEELQLQSYDTEWSIAQVLSHLGSQAELFESWIDAGTEGTELPGRESMQAVWGKWNARGPEEQAAESLAYNERLVERLEGASDEDLQRFHLQLFGTDLDAVRLVGMRLAEHAVHTWDVAVTLDPSAEIAPDAVALLVDNLPQLVQRTGKPQGSHFRLHVHTTRPERDFLLDVGDTISLAPWADEPADGELQLSAEAFVRLLYGRLDPDHTPPVQLTANTVDLDDLRRVFPGF
jgi:uncharacterized protein (TIGR03083 family)